MARSAWYIWLHPLRSRDELEQMDEETATLRDLLERTERERSRLQEELTQKTERSDAIIRQGDEERALMKNTIRDLEADKEDLKAEILEWEQTRIELDAIAEQLKEWEKVKERYEDHIKMLTLRLRDARGRKGDFAGGDAPDDSDILEDGESAFIPKPSPIDMLAKQRPKGPTIPASLRDEEDTDDSDPASSGSDTAATTRRTPRRRRLPKDDSDWLMTLPPE